jgi:hypothetical protein
MEEEARGEETRDKIRMESGTPWLFPVGQKNEW